MNRQSNDGIVRNFSAWAFAEPLEKAARLFEKQTQIYVAIDIRGRVLEDD